MKDGADVAADEAHRGAWSDHLHPAQAREVRNQLGDPGVVERVGGGIERHGDVGLGSGYQVHRHAVLLEHLEGVGEETDLVPHARRVERDERDALLGAHRFHLRAALAALGREHGALEARRLRRIDVQRDAVLPRRQDAARVQDLGAAGGDLLRLVVVQRAQQPRRRRRARIRAEHARHVGPDLQPLRAQLRGQVGGGGVRAAAPEEHGVALLVARDEALGHDQRCQAGEPLLERRVGLEAALGGQHARAPASGLPRVGAQHAARVRPADLEAARGEKARAEPGRHQLAHGEHARPRAIADLTHQGDARGDLTQLCEVPLDLLAGGYADLGSQAAVALLDGAQLFLVPLTDGGVEQPLQAVGDPRDGRVNDQDPRPGAQPFGRNPLDVQPVGESGNARAAEFEDDPGGRRTGHCGCLPAIEALRRCGRGCTCGAVPFGPGLGPRGPHISSSKSLRSFSSFLSASTSSRRLHAALPRLP